ncbi:S-layer homology domain-containing protein [Paenibacillus sp. 2TAB26]|uniref:S-layer homology domain-containing protein n=1 Tax=Paenibacillus sp. 2TAB26 TaxID=3233005 RepID=UPI003F95032F
MYKCIRFFRAPLLVILSFLVVFSQIVWFSSTTYGAGSSWNTLNNPINNTSNQFLGMGYGNGIYVAVGSNGLIATSSDAAKWTTRSTNSTQNLNEVDYGNNVYVAAGAGGTILYSTDAVTWNAATSNTSNQLFSVKFLNGSFWAVGASGIILKSSDGQSWTSIASGISNDLYNISYGNSKYVLGDANGKIYYSATGNPSTWGGGQQLNSTYYSSINFIGFLNNHFYAFDSSPILASYRSSDALTWTSTPLAWQAFAGAYGNGVYVLYSNANTAFTSTDGVSWTERTTNYGNTMQAITFGNGKFVAAGNSGSIMYSLDGIEWTTVTPNITDTVYNNGLYVAVGYNNSATIGGTIFTSTDRVNWTSRITPTANGFSSIAYGNGTYVAVGSGGTIYASSNATNWNLAASNTASNLQGVQFVNNRFIAVGNSGTILTSSDGTSWTPAAITAGPAITTVLYSVAYGNGTYVAVGQGSRMAYSSDGLNWTASSLTGSSFIFRNVVYANNLFVAVGASGKIFTSSDGTSSNWTSQDSTATGLLTGIAYGAGQFMVSGIGGKIVSSPDGASWTSEATNVAAFLTNVVYDGSRFLSLGYNFTTIEAAAVVSSPPLIIGNPSNASINEGGNASFTVAASNASSYQWQVNTGAGFSNIVNSSTYSGATTSTLTITGATVGMNGYQYRVIATGSIAPSATSNSATLTVKAPSIASTIMFKSNAGIAGNATVVSDGQGGSDDIPGFSLDFSAKSAVNPNKDLVLTYEIPYPDTIGASGLSAGYADNESQSIWTIKSRNSSQNFSLESITLIDSGTKDVKIGAFNDGVQVGEWVDLTISVDPWKFTFDHSNGLNFSFDNIDEIRIIPQDSEMWTSINDVQIGDPVTRPAPSITSNPSNATINEGDNATFTVAASNASSYQWQVNMGAGFTNISDNTDYTGATTVTLVIKSATAGMSGYHYRVVASGSTTPAATSNSATLTVIPMNVPLADFANTSKTGTSATFTWSAATGATSLKIEQSPTGANTWTTATTGVIATNATTATVTGLSAATGYDFRLVVTGGANAGNSNVVNVTTNSVALIDFASTSKTGTSATFTWSAATGATGLKIEQSPAGANTWSTAATGALATNATTATVTGLSAATGYDFRLVVTGGANAGDSNVVTVTTNPIALTDFASASKTGTSAMFTWSAATGATNIKVEQSPTGANTWTTATTGVLATNATTATVTGLSAATGYDFRLVVTGGANAGDSNVVTVTTNTIALTDFASASKTGTSATFTWSAATNATNIKVEQSPIGANTWTTAITGALSTNATTATVTGLSAATGYDFRLVVTGGANAGDSNVVTVTTNPIALTDFVSASKTGTSATFTWSAATGATNIKVEQSPTGANTWTTATTGALATNATTATVTGLSAATGYDFRLVVTGGANAGDSNVVTVTTNPIALTDFASASKTGTSATFTWSAATGATNIKVEQSPTGANTWTKATTGVIATNATTATVTGLSAATGYDFRLVVTGGANAGDSNVVTVTTDPIALTDFASASKTGTSAMFTWSAATGASGLKIEQSPTGANTWTTATTGALSTNATTAMVTGLSAATGYDFRLVVTGGENAGDSNVVTVTTNPITLTDFASASKTGTSATFTWSAAKGATNIKVEQSPTGANTWTTATTGALSTNATTATVTGLSAATGYDFRLVVAGGANAGNSNVVTVTTNPIALTDFASASKTGTSTTFTWSAATGATNIKVEQSPAGANTWTTATTDALSTNATTATVTGLSAATGYDFRLVVTGGANAGDSNVVTVTTNPIALTDFASASKTGTSATFTWSAATGATNIKVEQSPTGANTWTTATTGAIATNATTATVTGLSAATGYDFRLVVTGGANAGNSNVLTVITYSIEPSQPNPPKTDETDVEVLVNGKIEYAGKATTAIVNNQKVTTIIVDPNKLKNRLESESQHAVITIPLKGSSDVYASQINGQIIADLEQKQAILVLQHDQFTYTIPASQISIDALTKLFGKKLNLQDLKLEIEIAKPIADTIKMVESAAVKGQFEMVVPPLNFTVRASYDGKTIEVSKFDAYVERMIAIPAGVDPNRITTGIVVEPDGSFRHVPTRLVVKNEKYYAVVNSLTNSTYTIVWHPLAFKDVDRHWAKEAVNDMGSRMVITGVGNEMFNPNKSITRAEFAAIIVRGLGLKLEASSSSFSDVNKNEWYSSYIQTAFSNGLINGYEDGTFRPMDKITREQAMAIIAKAMKITGLKPSLAASEAGELLLPYKDANAASEWAKSSILDCLQVEIFSGRSSTVLAPKDEITRAEVAVIIQRLLKKSNLI